MRGGIYSGGKMVSIAPQWHYGFTRFAGQVSDFRPAFEDIKKDFIRGETEQFRSQGMYGSGGWKPLSPRYAAWKEQVRPGMPLLVFNGDLRYAATHPQTVSRPQSLTMIVDDSSGSRPAKALYHQTGTPHMPGRPVIELPQSQRVRWYKIIQAFVVAETRRPWR